MSVAAASPAAAPPRFDGLRALFINCHPEEVARPEPHPGTRGHQLATSWKPHGVRVDVVRAIDHDIATGVWPDMREHGWGNRRLAGILEKGQGGRHPGARTDRSGSATTARS